MITIKLSAQKIDTLIALDSIEINYEKSMFGNSKLMRIEERDILNTPKFMGLSDPLKYLNTMPGFGNGGDGNGGVYFRGLGSEQNGYYLNGIQVLQPTHLFGLFPIFNSNVIKDINVYSSVIPGNYSGKISSTIDINSNWSIADTTVYKLDASLFHIGLGYRVEDNGNKLFEVNWRKTFMNKTLWPFVGGILNQNDRLRYDLHDFNLNAKVLYKGHSFKTTFYSGRDAAEMGMYENNVSNVFDWGNQIIGITHNYDLARGRSLQSSVSKSKYDLNLELGLLGEDLAFTNRQFKYVFESQYRHTYNRLNWKTGLFIGLDVTDPIISKVEDNAIFKTNLEKQKQYSFKYYVDLDIGYFNDLIKNDFSLGLMKTATHLVFEPQVSLIYNLDRKRQFYISNITKSQPMHHIALTNVTLPIELTVMSKDGILPTKMNQSLLGFKSSNRTLEYLFEFYYRKISNIYEFDGNIIETLQLDNLHQTISKGRAISYGLDAAIRYKTAHNLINLNYSFARSFRQVDGINLDNWFPYIYDRPHNLKFNISHKLHEKLTFNSSFIFNSGSTFTPIESIYFLNNNLIGEYGTKNSNRISPYHRLDVGMEYILKKRKSNLQKLNISIINLYNRKNPIYKYQSLIKDEESAMESYKTIQKNAGFLPILPSITYSIEL